MKILKDEYCPNCGGMLRISDTEIICLSCNLRKPIPNVPKIRKALEEKTIEAPNAELTLAGNFIERATRDGDFFGSVNKVTRLVVNLVDGYQLKDDDKEFLLKAGFLRMEVK